MRGGKSLGETLKNALDVLQHIVIPEADHEISPRVQICGSDSIGLAIGMLTAVDLDDKAGFSTKKVYDVGANRKLTTKLGVCNLTIANAIPKKFFSIRR